MEPHLFSLKFCDAVLCRVQSSIAQNRDFILRQWFGTDQTSVNSKNTLYIQIMFVVCFVLKCYVSPNFQNGCSLGFTEI